jgi:hypothetical protein
VVRLTESVTAWATPDFKQTLKREIERLDRGRLPLQEGLAASSSVADEPISVMVLDVADGDGSIRARVGVLYAGTTGGCSCADDPTPLEPQNEYCEMSVTIDKETAEATFVLVAD